MNVKNNKRRRESIERIEKVFIELLQSRELNQITVSDICKLADINRSTFYANFADIYELADKMRDNLEADFSGLFPEGNDMASRVGGGVKMFRHIAENQIFYKTYFKLGYDNEYQVLIYDVSEAEKYFGNKHVDYHIEFFRSGLNAIIKKWLDGGCKESPEDMAEVITSEYQGRA